MPFDAHKNFAYSLVATAPSPATSGTSLVVTAADGAKFPTVPFNATVWPTGVQPLTTNAEVVRVTARASDSLTIIRTQESSSARSIVVGDQIAATITTKIATDLEALFSPGLALSTRVGLGVQTIPAATSASIVGDYEIPLTAIAESTDTDDHVALYDPATYNAQSFMASSSFLLDEIQLLLIAGGSPVDNLILEIRSDNAGVPSSTVLATVTIAATSVSASAFYSFKPASALSIGQAIPYWLVVRRSGVSDAVNKINWKMLTTGTYTGGRASDSFDSGATWDTFIRAWDFCFKALQYGVTELAADGVLEIT